LPSFLSSYLDLIIRSYELARPFGLKKLLLVVFFSFMQGLFQVLGATSIFPFLALAADPQRLQNSRVGREMLALLPPMEASRLLLIAGVFAIVMLVLSNAINVLGDFTRHRYSQRFGHWLRLRLIDKIAARPYSRFLQENTGVLSKKVLGDVNQFTSGVLLNILDTFTRLITAVLLLTTLFLVQPQIAIGAAVGLGLIYGVFFKSLSGWRAKASLTLKASQRGAFKELQQLLGGIKPVKVHRAESYFIDRYGKHSETQSRLHAVIPVLSGLPRYLIEPVAFGGLVIAVLIFIGRGQDLATLLPTLGVMAIAGYRLLPAIQLLYSQLSTIATSRHALEEVYDEFRAVERSKDREQAGAEGIFPRPKALTWTNEIQLEEVTFCYAGAEKPVIDRLSLTIPKNASIGIIGHTGAGKSTLVDLILGLHVPTAGRILVDDTALTPANRRAWRAGIGYVPQDIFLLDNSVTANIAFGVPENQIDHDAVRNAAAAAQILEFVETGLPNGFDTVVGERGVRLSGGQRQRIGLARALYHRPEILILDEATSALDLATEAEVMKAIRSLQGSVTMILIAHRLSTIEHCDMKVQLGVAEEEKRKAESGERKLGLSRSLSDLEQ
jgi:ATP-binding cassette, subfamily B, bacterial PglK